ncbi:MAG TPA: DUF1003 domain-containing protein [Clostridia bacterium]|nr:MAG: hypothetical protein BWY62_00198 [Firmicutes bacterium ADurb.Bin356]HOR12447.1 DUF1003 domain-containing protein [Clostridia bacterium]
MHYNRNSDLILRILEDQEERSLEDEEIIRLLLEEKLSKNSSAEHSNAQTISGRAADAIARFVGSWPFILLFLTCLLGWVVLNTLLLKRAVDPYPYILLNLILSCVAAIQAPVIMMSQNRQEEKDRLRAQNDYKTNLKSEILIEELYNRLDALSKKQEEIINMLNEGQGMRG